MIPPTKFQEALYRFNTMLMHIWFIVSDYFPHRLVRRYIGGRAFRDSLNGRETWFVKRERKRQLNYFKKTKKRLRKNK